MAVNIKRLDRRGHSECVLSVESAQEVVTEEIDQGRAVFDEETGLRVESVRDGHSLVIVPQVVGG